MTVEQLRRLWHADPFEPFQFVLTDGRAITVQRREWFGFSPTGNSVAVATPDDRFVMFDPATVKDIKRLPKAKRRMRRPRD